MKSYDFINTRTIENYLLLKSTELEKYTPKSAKDFIIKDGCIDSTNMMLKVLSKIDDLLLFYTILTNIELKVRKKIVENSLSKNNYYDLGYLTAIVDCQKRCKTILDFLGD